MSKTKNKIKKTSKKAIILVLVGTLLNALGQFFLKTAAIKGFDSLISYITNISLIVGLILYGISALLLILALRNGELSVLYPIFALTYVWVMVISSIFFNEVINLFKTVGVLFIIGGIILIGVKS